MDMTALAARASLVLTAVLGLSGCADYPAVGTLSKGMSQSVASWKPLVGDYSETCRRRLSYHPDDATIVCNVLEGTQDRIDGDLTALDGYFQALGALAVDANYSVEPAFKSLADAAKAGKADADQVAAASGLASSVASIFTAAKRRHSLDDLIDAAPKAVAVVDHLKSAINDSYPGQLEQEATQWQLYLAGPAGRADRAARLIDGQSPPIGVLVPCDVRNPVVLRMSVPTPAQATMEQFLFQRMYEERCNAIKTHYAALGAFDASADEVRRALTDLIANRAKLRTKDAVKSLFDKAEDLYRKSEAVRKAFAPAANSTASGTAS